jgi:hypothetical protein
MRAVLGEVASIRSTGRETTWESPYSGFTYRLRMVTDAAFTTTLKSIPSISSQNGGAVSAQAIDENAQFRRALVEAAIVSCDAMNDVEAADLPYMDVLAIQSWVQTGKKLVGPDADEMRRVL